MKIMENPFYFNYVFGDRDLRRTKIKWWQHPILWLKPTYVQLNDGLVFFFKRDGQGRIYLMDVKKERI